MVRTFIVVHPEKKVHTCKIQSLPIRNIVLLCIENKKLVLKSVLFENEKSGIFRNGIDDLAYWN